MSPEERAARIVDKMYGSDPFSRWLGIERLEEGPGRSVLRLQVRKEMLNGFGIAHGGITFSLADSALAFASNAHGRMALSVETSISHTSPVRENDVLTATAMEEFASHKMANYRVEVRNQEGKIVALFKGIVYRKDQEWEV